MNIDKDEVRETTLATHNGEVFFFGASGYMMTNKQEVPRRRVWKDEYADLSPDPVDHSQSKDNSSEDAQAVNVQDGEALEAKTGSFSKLFCMVDGLNDGYIYDHDDYVGESM